MNDIPRRTWAPFVGAALAVLTAGSLVVFSLVAQRTSLDGFPERRVAAPSDTTSGSPVSITIAPLADDRTDAPGAIDGAESESESIIPMLPLIDVAQMGPSVTVAVVGADDTAAPTAGDTRSPLANTTEFDGRFRADGVLLANRREGGSDDGSESHEDAAYDPRHGGKHDHKSHEAKSKNKAKKSKTSKRRGNRARHGRGRSQARSSGASSSGASDGRARSSPAPRGKPESASSSKGPQAGSPPAHSNAGGSGNSHGKSKGKRKH